MDILQQVINKINDTLTKDLAEDIKSDLNQVLALVQKQIDKTTKVIDQVKTKNSEVKEAAILDAITQENLQKALKIIKEILVNNEIMTEDQVISLNIKNQVDTDPVASLTDEVNKTMESYPNTLSTSQKTRLALMKSVINKNEHPKN